MPQTFRESSTIVVSFPEADSVSAIGEFNNWSTVASLLNRIDENRWEFRAPLPDVEIERLGFFVILQGARSGRVINFRDLAQASQPIGWTRSQARYQPSAEEEPPRAQ